MTSATIDSSGSNVMPAMWQRTVTLIAAVWAGLAVLLHRDVIAMMRVWWEDSTFQHCMLIVPLLGWLVWQRREGLFKLTPRGWWPGLLVVGVGALAWLLGQAAGLNVARQLGLMLMLQGSVIALTGPAVTRALLFPLFYMFFLVPIGSEAVPALQTLTAKMTMALLGWYGIPAHIEGIFITTPTGYFKVAEACSGVKFLIAMIAYGVLVANLCFRTWPRRIAFLALCAIVPVLANGLRAFGTIAIADKVGTDFAAGFDHVFYGWIFFAVVIALVMGAGWRFFDRAPDAPAFDADVLAKSDKGSRAVPQKQAVAAALALALLPLGWSLWLANRPIEMPAQIAAPMPGGWRLVEPKGKPWSARFDGAHAARLYHFEDARGRRVDMVVALYDRQGEGRKLVGFGQGAVDPDGEWVWAENVAPVGPGRTDRIAAAGPVSRIAATYYALGGTVTGSAARVKLETLEANLLGFDPRAVGIVIATETGDTAAGRATLKDFLHALGPIDAYAARVKGQ